MARMTDMKTAIRSVLTSDTTYIGLLGNPTTEPYRTYYIYPPTTPVFPFVVFSMRPGVSDSSTGKLILSKKIVLDFVAWDQSANYEDIAERIVYLLNQYGSSAGYRIIYDADRSELYDKELNAYGLSFSFNVFHRRER